MGSSGERISGVDPEPVEEVSVRDWLERRVRPRGDVHALMVPDDGVAGDGVAGGGGWRGISAAHTADRVAAIAAGLVAWGVRPGDRVVVMAPTSANWTFLDLAVMSAGAVTVPLYESSSDAQSRAILERADARLAFGGSEEVCERLRRIDADLRAQLLDVATLDRIAADADDAAREELERRHLRPDSVATIVFTSGTTGDPKGVPLTHHQLVWTARQTSAHLGDALGPGQSTLLFLPLAHIFARVVVFAALDAGVELAYGRSIDDVPDDLRSYRPTFLLAVPRMLDRVVSGARRQATGWRRPVFDRAMRTAREWSQAERPGPVLRVRHRIADRLVLRALREGLGGRVRYAVSGGARLDPALGHTIAGAGITVLEGYGLTETTAPVSLDEPHAPRIGTVGRPLPGVSVRLGADDEILVRGPNVMTGYLDGDPSDGDSRDGDSRDGDFVDGWFRTGDTGRITDDGHLVVIGRAKDVIVTDGGKNVAPAPLEDALVDHPAVTQAMVIGDDRPFIAALVVLDDDEAPSDPDARRRLVQEVVDGANAAVSAPESIREFRIVDRPFTEDDDELTPTLKLRRQRILEHFSDDVDAIYAGARSG